MPKSPENRVRLNRRALLGAGGAAMFVAACDAPAVISQLAGPQVGRRGPTTVALLTPGGGDDQGRRVIARGLENATRLAIRDLSAPEINLRVYQTGGDAGRAASQAAQAVNDGADIILGPLFGDSARAVGSTVAPRGINVLSFSNNPSVAGGNVFLLGPMFENTAHRLLSYAADQGKGRVMIIAERNESGRIAEQAIRAAAVRTSANVVGSADYEFSQRGIISAMPQIADRARSSGAQMILMTAGSEGALPLLVEMLPQNDVQPDTFQFAGLTRWDIPPATLQLSGLQGGWFALPEPSLSRAFNSRYSASFGEDPHPTSVLAFDGMAAIGALLNRGGDNPLSAASLRQGAGFIGGNSVFRFRSDNTNERGLAVAEVRDRQVSVLSPAPRRFPGAGA